MNAAPLTKFDTIPNPAVIAPNNFKFKSLSDWSYNIAMGCRHGCTFVMSQIPLPSSKKPTLKKFRGLFLSNGLTRDYLVNIGQIIIGGAFAYVKDWNENAFRASLRKAQKAKDEGNLTPDGNSAIMFCTTTDPYQALGGPKAGILRELLKNVVRNALKIILEESDLNVRILTRSPAARRDFDLFKRFADQNRILFGMSLPTFDPSLSEIYEANAPRPDSKFTTLQKAVQEGIPVFVAMAPTLPDEGESELRETISKLMTLNPVTIFHEPINLRAENLARIEAKAHSLGRSIRSDVFRSRERWREYAFSQFALVDRICDELGVPEGVLHQWPDEDLASKNGFLKMKKAIAEREFGPDSFTKDAQANADEEWELVYEPWINYWHNPEERISAWPRP